MYLTKRWTQPCTTQHIYRQPIIYAQHHEQYSELDVQTDMNLIQFLRKFFQQLNKALENSLWIMQNVQTDMRVAYEQLKALEALQGADMLQAGKRKREVQAK